MFPSSKIPLHIFEERYKIMINECLQTKTGFGIVSLINNKISDVGSYVLITNVLNKYPAGEMDIVVEGKGRFKILNQEKHPTCFLQANVEIYNDLSTVYNPEHLEKLKNIFSSLLSRINFKLEDVFWENYRKTELKSYKIAEKSGLTLDQQQELLALQKENERIDYLTKHLLKLEKKLDENVAAGSIIMGDGYL